MDFVQAASPPDIDIRVLSTQTGDKKATGYTDVKVILSFMKVILRLLAQGLGSRRIVIFGSQGFVSTVGVSIALVMRPLGKDVYLRINGGGFDVYFRSLGAWSRRFVEAGFNRCSRIVVQTDLVRRALEPELRVPVTAVSNYRVPIQASAPRVFEKQDLTVLYCGIVRAQKGVAELLQAFKTVRESLEGQRVRLVLTGPVYDDVRLELESAKTEYGTDLDVRGRVSHDEAVQCMREADVLAFPTYWPSEGHAGVLVEAQMIGLPIVTSDWRANTEVVTDGETGLLCAAGSPEDLASKLVMVLADADLRKKLSVNSARQSNRFDAALVCAELAAQLGMNSRSADGATVPASEVS